MGFDWAHTISSISKLILRAARNADDGGSGDSGSKNSRFESVCDNWSFSYCGGEPIHIPHCTAYEISL